MPSERSASSTSFLYSPVSGRPVKNLRHRCSHHIHRIRLQIQPVIPDIIRQNHRHPVVNERNALRRFSREDGKHRLVSLDPVQSRHVQHAVTDRADVVLDLLLLPFLPFEVAARRDQASPVLQTILEHALLVRRLAPGIDDPPSLI